MGYYTGATLAGLAACVDQRLRAAVLFYPSQPALEVQGNLTPANLTDLLWAITARTVVLYGDQDVVLPPERFAELRRRLEAWHVDHELAIDKGPPTPPAPRRRTSSSSGPPTTAGRGPQRSSPKRSADETYVADTTGAPPT